MDGLAINQKIRFGYYKAAQKLGQPFDLYRSAVPIDPLNEDNLVGSIKAVFTVDWQWMKSNKPGNAIWWALVDGRDSTYPLSAQEGDYLVGDKTFFILSKEFQMPMSAVECNRTVDVRRPSHSIEKGNQGYSAYTQPTASIVASKMPVSILKLVGRGVAESKLPTDTVKASYIIQMPNLGNVEILTGDIMTDETSTDYILGLQERTDFGWRFTGEQVFNGVA